MNQYQDAGIMCDKCGKTDAKVRRISKSYGKGDTLLVIENVPMISCPNCREMHFSAETIEEIERIKSQRQSVAIARPVPVAVFA